jgi:dTDP-glucose 4,6-dehydratase
MNKKIVYVTGCLGFIGSHVTEACLKRGWYVMGVDKCTYASNEGCIESWSMRYGDHFEFIKSDINDLDRLYDCDYIINTAAETHVDNSIEDSDAFVHSNINGVHHLLKMINKKKYKKPVFLHFSTDEVYGDIEEGSHTETDLLKPSNPYSATKAAADHLVTSWGRTYGLPYIIVRPTNNYGIGQYVEKLIPKTIKYLSVGRKVDLHNNGTPVRTWLNANDTAKAVIHIIESGVTNEIFNISGNYETQNIEVVKKIVALMGLPGPVDDYISHMVRIGQDVRYSVDDSKLKNLGWQPYAEFDIELALIVQYYKDNFIW